MLKPLSRTFCGVLWFSISLAVPPPLVNPEKELNRSLCASSTHKGR